MIVSAKEPLRALLAAISLFETVYLLYLTLTGLLWDMRSNLERVF